MTKDELEQHLLLLGLSQTEAAKLLGVTGRTVRRWFDDGEIPGPVEQALRAWLYLHQRDLPWGPDSIAVTEDNRDHIAAERIQASGLPAVLARTEFRGGAKLPWKVHVKERYAELGPMRVSFYLLEDGRFSLSVYTRKDMRPNIKRDREFIEDAAYCIDQALKALAC